MLCAVGGQVSTAGAKRVEDYASLGFKKASFVLTPWWGKKQKSMRFLIFSLLLIAVMSSGDTSNLHGHERHRNEWSQMVGQEANVALEMIKKERPELNVITVPHVSKLIPYFEYHIMIKYVQNAMLTMDYRTDRVRVFVDEHGKVVRPPTVG